MILGRDRGALREHAIADLVRFSMRLDTLFPDAGVRREGIRIGPEVLVDQDGLVVICGDFVVVLDTRRIDHRYTPFSLDPSCFIRRRCCGGAPDLSVTTTIT